MNLLSLSLADLAIWMFAAALLVGLLAGAMTRRRKQLTELLREHVESKLPSAEPPETPTLDEGDS